jgi:hypothetical protein
MESPASRALRTALRLHFVQNDKFGNRFYCGCVKSPVAMLALLAFLPIADLAQSVPPPLSSSYGAYPGNYQEIVTTWLNANLVDPRSVVIKWLSEPKPGELTVSKDHVVSGFLVDFSVNARNLFGSYTGPQKHTALIRDGQVVTATGFVFH